MSFIMNETFIQIMDKFNEELQLQIEPGLCHSDSL
jgi:hypothetical protein